MHWVKIEYLDVVGNMRGRSQQLQVNLALTRQPRLLFLSYLNSRRYFMTLRACSQTNVTLFLRYERSTGGIPSSSAKKLRTLFAIHSGLSSPTLPSALSQEWRVPQCGSRVSYRANAQPSERCRSWDSARSGPRSAPATPWMLGPLLLLD